MSNSEKILKTLSELIEKSILTSKDIKKEISNDFKFKSKSMLETFFQNASQQTLKKYDPFVKQINNLEKTFTALTDSELKVMDETLSNLKMLYVKATTDGTESK